jgi:glycerol-3-phosphate cytidylyltransferase/D-beta-D-heptose 7-phosphate kinase/D-beta-D-heptose 1-phosphate adenosyltransferase
MAETPQRASIVSGYFNPLHVGHLRMMNAARDMTGYLIIVVNNDVQQIIKKGRIILPLDDRLEVVRALRAADEVVAAVDEDPSIRQTLREIRASHPHAELIFGNGGDRTDSKHINESDVCDELGIGLRFGVGGEEKADSSTRIVAAVMGEQSLPCPAPSPEARGARAPLRARGR